MNTAAESRPALSPNEEAPLLAHFEGIDQFTALCGKRLMGVPAPATAPHCVVCDELWKTKARSIFR
jgi:hypothetical protein